MAIRLEAIALSLEPMAIGGGYISCITKGSDGFQPHVHY